MSTKLKRSALGAVALAGLLACQNDPKADIRQVASPGEDTYASPGEVRFLYDDQGNVPRQIPSEVLQNMRRQLSDQGQETLLKDLEARYDFASGEVRDAKAAEAAERYLKSQLPLSASPAATDPAVVLPADLPEGIAIPPELVERLGKAGAR
jgi:hypothetical protein